MKKLYTAVLVATLGLVASPMVLAKEGAQKTVKVQFKKGAYSASYNGQIKGSNYDQYQFYAKKGQKLTATATGGNTEIYLFNKNLADSVYLNEFSPNLDENGAYTLPYSGKYTIRVSQPRAMARQNKQPKYTLKIAIR